jgi:hypothetical protein
MFRVEGPTRRQILLRGLFLWLAAPASFFACNAATHHGLHIFTENPSRPNRYEGMALTSVLPILLNATLSSFAT